MFLINLRKLKVNMPWYFYYWLKCNKYSNISKGRAGSTTGKNLKALITWALWSKRCQYRCKVGPKGANENMKGYILLHGLETRIANNDLLYSTGSSAQYSVIMGKWLEKEWIYVYVQRNHFAIHLKLNSIVHQLCFNTNTHSNFKKYF